MGLKTETVTKSQREIEEKKTKFKEKASLGTSERKGAGHWWRE